MPDQTAKRTPRLSDSQLYAIELLALGISIGLVAALFVLLLGGGDCAY